MEDFVRRTLLYDFYGELLTQHQQTIYEDVVLNDLSCSEVAREQGVSRQGINELIRKCDRQLEDYEDKLGLVSRFVKIRDTAGAMRTCLDGLLSDADTGEDIALPERKGEFQKLRNLTDTILEEL